MIYKFGATAIAVRAVYDEISSYLVYGHAVFSPRPLSGQTGVSVKPIANYNQRNKTGNRRSVFVYSYGRRVP